MLYNYTVKHLVIFSFAANYVLPHIFKLDVYVSANCELLENRDGMLLLWPPNDKEHRIEQVFDKLNSTADYNFHDGRAVTFSSTTVSLMLNTVPDI